MDAKQEDAEDVMVVTSWCTKTSAVEAQTTAAEITKDHERLDPPLPPTRLRRGKGRQGEGTDGESDDRGSVRAARAKVASPPGCLRRQGVVRLRSAHASSSLVRLDTC